MEFTLEEALKASMDRRVSDVHISVGRPVMIRVDGKLVELNEKILMPKDVEELLLPIISDKLKVQLDTEGEIDFAYSLGGIGRFRLNVFKQRGTYALSLIHI